MRKRVHLAVVGEARRAGRSRGAGPLALSAFGAGARAADGVMTQAAVGEAPYACASGCAWCCSYKVAAHGIEVFAIVHHIKSTRTAADVGTLIEKLRSNLAAVAGLDSHRHAEAKVPCALLDTEQRTCTVYDARPIACRTLFSRDAEVCRVALEPDHDPDLAVPLEIGGPKMQVSFGMLDALAELKLDMPNPGPPQLYDLHAALLLALEDETLGDRWVRNEDVFASAAMETSAEDLNLAQSLFAALGR